MRTRKLIIPAMFLACWPLLAQESRDERNRALEPQNEEINLPIPISSPRALEPGVIDPLTPKEKLERTIRNATSPKALANRALMAGWNHWKDHPEEWSGNLDGYAARFGSRMGRLVVRNAIELASDVAFKTDPRYDRCNCLGFKSRTMHAWRRVLVARRDDGSEMISVSRLAGAYVTPMITDQWYPARLNTWEHKFSSGSQFLAWRGATNMLREFWPEISRKLPFGRKASPGD